MFLLLPNSRVAVLQPALEDCPDPTWYPFEFSAAIHQSDSVSALLFTGRLLCDLLGAIRAQREVEVASIV